MADERLPQLQEICTSVAVQALVREGREGFEREQRIHQHVMHQLDENTRLRRAVAPHLLQRIVRRCPQLLTDKLLLYLLSPSLRVVDVAACTGLRAVWTSLAYWMQGVDAQPENFTDSGQLIRTLDAFAPAGDDATLAIQKPPHITELNVSQCNVDLGQDTVASLDPCTQSSVATTVTVFTEHFLRPNADYLTSVNISRTRATDTLIKLLLTECSRLESLEFSDCACITDKALDFVTVDVQELPHRGGADIGTGLSCQCTLDPVIGQHLQHINMSDNDTLTFNFIQKLVLMCQQRLQSLDVSGCSNLGVVVFVLVAGFAVGSLGEFPLDDDDAEDVEMEWIVDSLAAGDFRTVCSLLRQLGIDVRGKLFHPELVRLNAIGVQQVQPTALHCSAGVCETVLYMSLATTLKHLEMHAVDLPPYIDLPLPMALETFVTDCHLAQLAMFCKNPHILQRLHMHTGILDSYRDLVHVVRQGTRPWLSLKWSGYDVEDDVLDAVLTMCGDTLEELNLMWCDQLTDESLRYIFRVCTNMRRLDLRKLDVLPGSLIALRRSGGPTHITHLGLNTACTAMTDDDLLQVIPALPSLVDIDLGWNSHLKNDSIKSLLVNCPHLERAGLEGLKHVTAEPFWPLVVGVSAESSDDWIPLTKESMPAMKDQSNVYIRRSVVYGRSLRYLNLTSCEYVDDEELMTIARATYGSLEILDYYCALMTPDGRVRVQ